jgi:hypothetical protein
VKHRDMQGVHNTIEALDFINMKRRFRELLLQIVHRVGDSNKQRIFEGLSQGVRARIIFKD